MDKELNGKKVTKKEARQLVYDRLVVALAEFKTGIKDKKFETNLRKTSKLFAVDFAKASNKEKNKTKKIKSRVAKKDVPITDEKE